MIEGSYFERAQKEVPVERDGLEITFLDAHRPLEDYTRALEEAELVVDRLRELRDDGDPDDSRWQRVPLFLHLRARKS